MAEVPLVAPFWFRPGNTAGVRAAATFLDDTLARRRASAPIRLVRANGGFCGRQMRAPRQRHGLGCIMTAARRCPVRKLCRHDDAAWTPIPVSGVHVQEFTRAAVFSHKAGQPAPGLAVHFAPGRRWWNALLQDFARSEEPGKAVAACSAGAGPHRVIERSSE